MISSRRALIAMGVLALVLSLVSLFPARVAIHWFAPPEISIGGIHGSVWSGSAGEASVGGVYVRDLNWRFKPLHLLVGKLSYRIVATPPGGILKSDFSVGFGGSITLGSLNAKLPLGTFSLGGVYRGVEGDADLDFSHIELRDGIPTRVDGTLTVANLVVPMASRDSLGGYEAKFSTQDNGVTANIKDMDGVVVLTGGLQINSDRTFAFIGGISAKSNTPAGILQQMRFLPPADARGKHELRFEGEF